MEGVIEYYHEVVFNEPAYHKLLDWLCILVIVFISVYGIVFYFASRYAVQGVVTPDATPYQKSLPSAQPSQYPIEQT